VADLIKDLQGQDFGGGLSSWAAVPLSAARNVNELFSRFQVSQPFYHLPVNVSQNVATSFLRHGGPLGVRVPGMVARGAKALVRPKVAVAEADAAGANFPYAEREFHPGDLSVLPLKPSTWKNFRHLTPEQRRHYIARLPGRAANTFSTQLL